jgi:RNA 2',3'-cyclic 3'-phosphodiesterase
VRLFFALWPDDSVRDALAEAARPLLAACPGRPVPESNYHLTLAFLGSVDADRLDAIRVAAADVQLTRFDLRIDGHGHWPRPQIAWLGCRDIPAAAGALAQALWTRLEPLGFKPEARPFRAHLTVLRSCPRCDWPGPVSPVDWPVREFVLARSVTLPAGARYQVIERWP